jgi:type IV secretion system protein VirB5
MPRADQAQAVAPALADYRPTDPQIAFHLVRLIEQVRFALIPENWIVFG